MAKRFGNLRPYNLPVALGLIRHQALIAERLDNHPYNGKI